MANLQLDKQTASRQEKTDAKTKLGLAGITLLIALGVVGICIMSPAVRRPIDIYLSKWVDPNRLYDPHRSAIDQALIGTNYSVMHVPQAGIAVVFYISKSDAHVLSDPTTQFVAPNPFHISRSDSPYAISQSGIMKNIANLEDCYAMSVPKRSVAAIIGDMDIISPDVLNQVLAGVAANRIGPEQTAGSYAIYDHDHALIQHLYASGAIQGTLQTQTNDQTPGITFGEQSDDIIVPIDKRQQMDVMLGENMRVGQQGQQL
ncbi:hypothetical protein CCAX7_46170 [Capsulimonas corticalis]|uniref:Uncharacterized protein n=1 Tax=Capsulimonas corticalis TaxID=2219043 RepID=A0A402D576_9BACT|nr:hypothetical protein [Capsulimonas corticalis]BDI32566.1 hypothetical protein CCAX7_46170 [Capsulimonas corticalis]